MFLALSLSANNATYLQRQSDYIDSMLQKPTGRKLILQAFKGLPLDSAQLDNLVGVVPTKTTSDFDIIELVRILFLSNGAYDSKILPTLNAIPFWMNKGDTTRNYWSENHMIMWSSSDWLLHEKYNKAIDSSVRKRIVHYLKLKNTFGYYEFFSSTYAPYCFAGILNLADFAQDTEIKLLAQQAAQKLLDEILLLTTNKGVFYPAAGRNYTSKYETPYGQNHNNLIYLLTGLGNPPTEASHAGPFLATSSLEVDSVINRFSNSIDKIIKIGHPLDTMNALHAGQAAVDKTVFQWSAGAYFHPDVVAETVQLLIDSSLWNHVDFELLKPLSSIQPSFAPAIATSLSCISKSTVICQEDVYVFKHNAISLSSIQDFWKGKVGFQQFPCVANVGTTAVYTASGKPQSNWLTRDDKNGNIHLPYVNQKHNVALLMYRPEPTPNELIGNKFERKEVALHFNDNDFDEITEHNNWLIGRQENGYVAVRRNCIGEIDSVRACPTVNGQSWAIVIGDSSMYGSFANFTNKVKQAQFTENWSYNASTNVSTYFAKVDFDTISIQYAWDADSTISSINEVEKIGFNLFPNPANTALVVEIPEHHSEENFSASITNTLAQEVLSVNKFTQTIRINTTDFPNGIYYLKLRNNQGQTSTKRFIVSH